MHRRIVIVGGPKTGKTTWANNEPQGLPVFHTDSLIPGRTWAEQGEAAFAALVTLHEDNPFGFIFEGCLADRALSRWLKTQPDKPCDQVVVLIRPVVVQTPAQKQLSKGILTRFSTLVPALRKLGVEIEWINT